MNLKCLVYRELGEGMTEKELASAVGLSVQTIANILADNLPQDPPIWEAFAGIFAFMRIFCDPVGRHTQMGCSSSQKAPIIPPSPHRLGTVIACLVSEGTGPVRGRRLGS